MHTFLNTLMCSVLFIYLQLMYILLLNEFFWNSLNWVRALRIGMWIFQILMSVFFWWGAVNDKSLQSCLRFSRQEYWSGLPCSFCRDFPNPGIETVSSVSCISICETLSNHRAVYKSRLLLKILLSLEPCGCHPDSESQDHMAAALP